MNTRCFVYIVDSDARIRRHLVKILRARHYLPTPFAAGEDFVEALSFLAPGISIIDLRLRDMNGIDVLGKTRAIRSDILSIVTATDADIRTAVQAIKGGADDFLEKPFKDEILLQMLAHSVPELNKKIRLSAGHYSTEKILSTLTRKELEMITSLLEERDNRKVADHFHVSIRTVESYRSRIMKKIGVRRFSDALLLFSDARVSRDTPS